MSDWRAIKLKDVCQRITVGHVGSMAGEYQESGIPFLRSLNISPFRISRRELKFIDRRFHDRLKKSALKPGDVAVVRTGYPGTACVIPEELGEANCSDLVLITPSPKLNPHFLAAIFNSTFGRDLVGGNLVGAAQQHFNITTAKELRLLIPSKPTQDKIAAILTAYDDLIEVNKRRIALLEQMAEELYREWFVRLRFPGHQTTKFIKGVPEGWEVIKIGERVSTQYGYTESADENPANPKFLRITDIVPRQINWDRVPHCPIGESDEDKYRLREGDIVVARTGATVGYAKRISKINWRAVFASYLVRLVPENSVDSIYLGMAGESAAFTGAAQPQANATTMSLFPLFYPDQNLLRRFNSIVQPLFDQKDLLMLQARNLTQTRDLLLPRLISGKLSVENLDIAFPRSMQETPTSVATHVG